MDNVYSIFYYLNKHVYLASNNSRSFPHNWARSLSLIDDGFLKSTTLFVIGSWIFQNEGVRILVC